MFSLFYGLWKYLFSKIEFHVLILGIDKAGKTTLLEKLKSLYSNLEGLPPDRIVPTVGLNIGRVEVSNTKLVFWDLGGQSGLRSIWEKYYEEAHAVIFVIDASSPSRFEDAKSALEKVLRHEDLQGAPLLILANQQDLPEALSSEELARYLDLKKLDERVYMFEAVSAYDGYDDDDDYNDNHKCGPHWWTRTKCWYYRCSKPDSLSSNPNNSHATDVINIDGPLRR
ncbi:hypothetical protein L6164_006097 [Bauhinia variegata]|uniref:Uncharacterized protein n=1 Tax=Bauhinia variegata TaxID=167791 RepID=A0ACB9PSV8_BAUVA|nr:hypothetical protein L6164_006097 [Bauhinia variegata]